MAIKDLVDKALLSAFWGNASEKIDARIAAAKASPATTSTAGLVKPGSGLAVASDGTLSTKVDGSTIDFNSAGQLTALGGGSAVKVAYLTIADGQTLSLGNLTMEAKRDGIYFIVSSQQQDYDALLINAVIPQSTSSTEPEFYFTCNGGKTATKWLVNGIENSDLISTQFIVPVLGGYLQRDATSYSQSYCTCAADSSSLSVRCALPSRKSFYLQPLTVVAYY